MIRKSLALGLFAFVMSSLLWAKGDIVRIEVKGEALASPIEIADPGSLNKFVFWDGPGINGATLENSERGSIIDWKAGIAAGVPSGLQRYEVSFYSGCRTINSPECLAEKPSLAYVLFYDYDPSSNRGWSYLPGRNDFLSLWETDSGTLYRGPGVAGHWFSATNTWAEFLGPLIARGRAAR